MRLAKPDAEEFSFADCETQLEQVQASCDAVKAALLHVGAGLRMPVSTVLNLLEQHNRIRGMARR